jgi:drug/metabolite transporter (DMT)-like permease
MALRDSRLIRRLGAVPDNARGMGYMLISAMTISGMNGVVQGLSHSMHVFEIAFFRQFFGLIFMAAMFLRGGLRPFYTRRLGLHVIRAILNVAALLLFFHGLSLEPLAKIVSLSMTAPLFATLCAVIFLKEKMTRHRWVALGLGFAGALIILRPGAEAVSAGALAVLASNAVWAVALVVIKELSRTDSSVTITLYATLLQTPVSFAFALFFWRTPTMAQFAWLIGIGICGSVAQICLAESFRHADATLVLPIDFTKLIWASLIGYFFFGQAPGIWIWIGAATVCSAVFYNAWKERRSTP